MSREENGCSDLTSAIPYSWRFGELTPLFKGKVSYWSEATFEESSYIMSHTVKLLERIINHMLGTIVQLGNIQFVLGEDYVGPQNVTFPKT